MKTFPKSLNYRYAGFQILDWNSNFQSSLVRTTDKLLQFFTHQDLFTIKKKIYHIYYQFLLTKTPSMVTFIYDNLVFFFIAVYQTTDSNCPSPLFFFFFPPSLRYNITHSSNLNFYLGITHLKKKITSNYMLIERPLSLKLIFHYYNQINRQRGRIIWMRDILTNFLCFLFFYSLFHFTVFVAGLFLFPVFFFLLFFSSSFLPARWLPLLFFSFLSFFSRQSVHLFVARFFLFFSFYFFQFHHFSLSFSFMSCCDA